VEIGRVLVYCAGEKGNISDAIAGINQSTLRRVVQNMVKRLNACIQGNGGVLPAPFMNCISGFSVL
jgi:hypothetical protein